MPDSYKKYNEFSKLDEETRRMLIKLSSTQRHEFMNMLQIITGYMQIEWYDQALNTALEYGQRTESTGRLKKHGLIATSYIIEHFMIVFSNFERKIEIVNSLPPTEQNLRKEKKEALELLDALLERYSNEPLEKLVLNFELLDSSIKVRLIVPECDNVEFMDLILKYKSELLDLETGSIKNETVWDYIEFGLFD